MKVLIAFFLLVAFNLVQLSGGEVNADSEGRVSVVESVLITENGTPIGSMRYPDRRSRLGVAVQSGDDQIQAVVQLTAVPGERFLLLTDLEDVVITGLSEVGVVGNVLDGGWSLDAKKEQLVYVNLAGRHPSGVEEFDLLEALTLKEEAVINEFRIEAHVESPILPFPNHLLVAGAGAGTAVAAIALIFLWQRGRRGSQQNWNY